VGEKDRRVKQCQRAGRWGGNIHALRLFESAPLKRGKKRANRPVKAQAPAAERIANAIGG
jgi:ribosomal protein L34E